jgi:hypothetical protein
MLTVNFGHAFDLDQTVDDDIRKNYKTEDDYLPALPKILQSSDTTKSSDITKSTPSTNPTTHYEVYKGGNIKIKKGTVFNVSSIYTISDRQNSGTQVKFTTKQPIHTKNCTIPVSTVFIGEIVESHQPQITCNGGLVVIQVHSMIYKGHTVPVNAYITRANDKKIFFNNIKGERNYLKTTWKKGNWGRSLFNRMMTLTVNLGGDGSTLILSPFPFIYGSLCLGANTILSPFCAFFSKGGHISIPAGKMFRIKLIDDIFV